MNKKILEILNNVEEGLTYGHMTKKEALEELEGIDLINIDLKKYKKIRKLLNIEK